jgi:hypothetical protein
MGKTVPRQRNGRWLDRAARDKADLGADIRLARVAVCPGEAAGEIPAVPRRVHAVKAL